MLPVQPLKGRYQRPDLRNHRKLMVVDGDVGFVGSLNMIDPSYDKRGNRRAGTCGGATCWPGCEGPVVQEIEALFVTDWYSETDEILGEHPSSGRRRRATRRRCSRQIAPSGSGVRGGEQPGAVQLPDLRARSADRITSPYFVPDESLLGAIITAARRGVAVELFVGEIGDQFFVFHAQHSYYAELLAGGRADLPLPGRRTILHAKHISIDDHGRGGRLVEHGHPLVPARPRGDDAGLRAVLHRPARAVEDQYRSVSRELSAAEWAQRGFGRSVIDNLMRLTSAVQ